MRAWRRRKRRQAVSQIRRARSRSDGASAPPARRAKPRPTGDVSRQRKLHAGSSSATRNRESSRRRICAARTSGAGSSRPALCRTIAKPRARAPAAGTAVRPPQSAPHPEAATAMRTLGAGRTARTFARRVVCVASTRRAAARPRRGRRGAYLSGDVATGGPSPRPVDEWSAPAGGSLAFDRRAVGVRLSILCYAAACRLWTCRPVAASRARYVRCSPTAAVRCRPSDSTAWRASPTALRRTSARTTRASARRRARDRQFRVRWPRDDPVVDRRASLNARRGRRASPASMAAHANWCRDGAMPAAQQRRPSPGRSAAINRATVSGANERRCPCRQARPALPPVDPTANAMRPEPLVARAPRRSRESPEARTRRRALPRRRSASRSSCASSASRNHTAGASSACASPAWTTRQSAAAKRVSSSARSSAPRRSPQAAELQARTKTSRAPASGSVAVRNASSSSGQRCAHCRLVRPRRRSCSTTAWRCAHALVGSTRSHACRSLVARRERLRSPLAAPNCTRTSTSRSTCGCAVWMTRARSPTRRCLRPPRARRRRLRDRRALPCRRAAC